MCGIAGFITSNTLSKTKLTEIAESMSRQIRHRGPDGEGIWADAEAGISLAHRRLAIVDLSPAGAQPMTSSSGDIVIVYNGEIYNAEDIRKELQPNNIPWRGTSDTEVIVEAINQWGLQKTVKKLIGMFAFAVWDRKSRRISLVRDRMGIKPLYWSKTAKSLLFGSELKALRMHPECPDQLNRSAIAGYLRNCYINNPSTIYADVQQLRPGFILHYSQDGGEPQLEQYWSLDDAVAQGQKNPHQGSDADAIKDLEELLTDAVSRRMISDVPLGAFLSGGIDSSMVVALMQKVSSKPVKTFSIGFNEEKFDESVHAAAVAKHLGTDHTQLIVTPQDALDVIPSLPTMFDEPFADASQIPTYLVSKLTRDHVTVALSGDGGDELFAGYNRYFDANKNKFILNQPRALRNFEAHILESVSPETVRRISKFLPNVISSKLTGNKLKRIPPLLRDGTELSLYRRLLSRVENPAEMLLDCPEPTYPAWEQAATANFGGDSYSFMQYIDALDYLPDDILTKVDRASMVVSLEARVPILDHRIVEFAWTLPQRMKVRNGTGKWILRELLYQHVPRNLVDRPKKGFGVPIAQWLRGPLRDWAEDLLSESSLKQTEIFKTEPVLEKWKQHQSGTVNWDNHLWDIINMQAWATANRS